MRDDCEIRRNVITRQERVLRLAGERGLSLSDIEAETKISKHTLKTYIAKPSRAPAEMPLSSFIKIARCLDKAGYLDLATLLIEDTGLSLIDNEQSSVNWLEFGGHLASLVSEICQASADGRIDHREVIKLIEHTKKVVCEANGVVRT